MTELYYCGICKTVHSYKNCKGIIDELYVKEKMLSDKIIEKGVNKMIDLSPDKIYLHDPLGAFQEVALNAFESVIWSEDRIDESDIEYVKVIKDK